MNTKPISNRVFHAIIKYFQQIIDGSEFDHHVYFVGGCVRDDILHRDIKDIDVVVDLRDGGKRLAYYLKDKGILKDDKIVELPTYNTYKFCIQVTDNNETFDVEFECTQTRKINPDKSTERNSVDNFGSIYDDAKCRDFTINALYYDIAHHIVISPLGNYAWDLIKMNILHCCDKPEITFNDDPLRVFRAVRFLSTLSHFDLHVKDYETIKEHNYSIANISWQRINVEMNKICMSGNFGNRDDIIELLYYIFQENCNNVPSFLHSAPKYEYVNKVRTWAEVVPQYMLNTMYKDGYNPNYINEIKHMEFSNNDFNLIKDIYTLVSKLMNIYKKGNINDDKQDKYYRLLVKYAYNNKYGNEITWKAINIACSYFNTIIKSENLQENGFLPRGFYDNNCYMPNLGIEEFVGYKLPITGDMIKETLGISEGPEIKQVMDYCFNEVVSGNVLNNDITSMLRLAKQKFGSTEE
jgi:hypothetical protein